jgi:triphosphoribosyl-dephospho-CoA synthase
MNEIERCVRTACLWEATARKAGNVHPLAEFDDLKYADFVRSGEAIAPVLDAYRIEPLGITILEAIRATRAVVKTNTNLGIVLLLAPLSKVERFSAQPLAQPPHPGPLPRSGGEGERRVPSLSPASGERAGVRGSSCDLARTETLQALIDATTIADAKHVYEAIRLAVPGGMGRVENQDVAAEPTQTLKEVMSLAADRDTIARQYSNNFSDVFGEGVGALLDGCERFGNVEAAILTCQIHWLARHPDSLIVRKRGMDDALTVQHMARTIEHAGGLATAEGMRLYADLDRWLRAEGHARNPGTTADLITACLFVALREHRMNEEMPFEFRELNP